MPAAELPLIIEDKSFVPDGGPAARHRPDLGRRPRGAASARSGIRTSTCPTRTASASRAASATRPIINARGRWDYLPWYWKGYEGTVNGPVANPLFGSVPSQPEEIPGTPDLSAVPNAFHDTMLVNGTAYPYVRVERKAYRLRILNACGDRQLNLQLYYARSDEIAETAAGRLARAADRLGRGDHASGAAVDDRRLAGALAHGHARRRRAGPPLPPARR